MKAHSEKVIRRRVAEKMPGAGLDQHPGVGGAPGQLLGVDLLRGGQPEGIGVFAAGDDLALWQVLPQRVIEALPALGRVVMVAPQVGFIMTPARKWAI